MSEPVKVQVELPAPPEGWEWVPTTKPDTNTLISPEPSWQARAEWVMRPIAPATVMVAVPLHVAKEAVAGDGIWGDWFSDASRTALGARWEVSMPVAEVCGVWMCGILHEASQCADQGSGTNHVSDYDPRWQCGLAKGHASQHAQVSR
jgi:hypothetical protein